MTTREGFTGFGVLFVPTEVIALAKRPLRPCRHPACGELTREGWCDRHKSTQTQQRRRESESYHGWYSKPIWTKRLRPRQLLEKPFCRACAGQGIRTRATVVDHVTPFRGDWDLFVDPANHQSLCKFHHDQKTAREQAAERRKNTGF